MGAFPGALCEGKTFDHDRFQPVESVPDGVEATWDWDFQSDTVVGSDGFFRLLGVPRTRFGGTIGAFLAEIRGEDRLEAWNALEAARRNGTTPCAHFRLHSAEGTIVAMYCRRPIELDAGGRPSRMKACLVNVTHLWRGFDRVRQRMTDLEDEVRFERERFDRLVHDVEILNSTISHDLRQPVRAVHGFVELLREELADVLDDTSRDHLERIRAGAVRVNKMMDGLLTLSRIHVMPMVCNTVDMSAMCRDIADGLETDYPRRNVEFRVQSGILARGDCRMLRTMLESLLDNAWKFTAGQSEARIEFSATRETPDTTVYELTDNGTGISGEWLGGLCKPFRRLHADQAVQGLGMGLALAAGVVHRHGGEIWYEPGPRAGATFRFRLGRIPEASAREDAQATAPSMP